MRRLSKKWANYRRKYYLLRRTETTPTGPLYINVEPTNACNLKCYTCSIDRSRERGYMDLDLFRSIIDQAMESGVYEVALFLGGEPLLHKDLPYMVEYTVAKGLEARVYTNACMLTREKSEALLDAGLDFLGLSIDGDNREEYEFMRPGADFEQVMENSLIFLKLKQERGLKKPYVSVQMLKLRDNPRQEPDPAFVARFDGLPIDEFSVRNPHDWRGEVGYLDAEKENRGKYYPCLVFWSAMSIAWDGRVVGCSADLNGRFILGDVREKSIMEIWNDEPMRRHRRLLKEGRYRELPLCADCHALWHKKSNALSLLLQLPPFEQAKNAALRLSPGRWRRELEKRRPGAIRTRK